VAYTLLSHPRSHEQRCQQQWRRGDIHAVIMAGRRQRTAKDGGCLFALLRLLLLCAMPLLDALGALGGQDEGDGRLALCGLSALAVVAEFVVHRRTVNAMEFGLLFFLLYVMQVGILLHQRFDITELQRSSPWGRGAAPRGGGALVDDMSLRHQDPTRELQPATETEEIPFGGKLKGGPIRTISVVLPCAEERENALNTVQRFCERTPEEELAEIVVVDDGSEPPLKTLFEKDSRRLDQNRRCKVKFLRHELTIGLMAAKLTGGRASIGDVVGFFDCHVAPQKDWHIEILQKVRANPRSMVVPAITDIDMDTFDEQKNSAVNAKCYLTFDPDFKWFDDESDFIPTISGGLVAMGREWFNITGGFDPGMHGWGGENLDQSLRSWLCGGDIVRAKTSRIAHMWRTGDSRTGAHYRSRASATNNPGRVVAAWFDNFKKFSGSGAVPYKEIAGHYDAIKKRLACKPFSYFLYRFRKVYIEAQVIPQKVFRLRDKATGLCLKFGKPQKCDKSERTFFQLSNVDLSIAGGKCCSGLRMYKSSDCLDAFQGQGPIGYACDVTGRNTNQHYRLREDGRIALVDGACMLWR